MKKIISTLIGDLKIKSAKHNKPLCQNCKRPALYEFTDIGRSLAFCCQSDICYEKIRKLVDNLLKTLVP